MGRILLNGLPTFFLVILLHFYLKFVFFKPMERTLAARFDATEGARKAADQSLKDADVRIGEYRAAIRAARGEIYVEQEKLRKDLREKHSAQIEDARSRTDFRLAQAKSEIEAEATSARQALALQSDTMAEQIAQNILRRKVA
ncbi:MAG: ATP synthase F0 subunit B [Acidobacteriota bacterium]|nr:ATP synthase F0 subunit B [Acidobacteriota bacterium]